MTDIELVVKIDEAEYIDIKNAINSLIENGVERASMSKVCLSILDGTPLPKGHGRLMILSEDKLKENQINLDFSCQKWISEVGLSNATVTIIEADGEV